MPEDKARSLRALDALNVCNAGICYKGSFFPLEEWEKMDWLSLDSSMLTASAYASGERTLYLRFKKTGDVYRYFDFPPQRYREFLAAGSKGRYFLNRIQDAYTYERLARSGSAAND